MELDREFEKEMAKILKEAMESASDEVRPSIRGIIYEVSDLITENRDGNFDNRAFMDACGEKIGLGP